jgi:hypothetical protein
MWATIAIIARLRIIPGRRIIPRPAIITIIRTWGHYHNRTGWRGRYYPCTMMSPIAISAAAGIMSPVLCSGISYYAKAEQDD